MTNDATWQNIWYGKPGRIAATMAAALLAMRVVLDRWPLGWEWLIITGVAVVSCLLPSPPSRIKRKQSESADNSQNDSNEDALRKGMGLFLVGIAVAIAIDCLGWASVADAFVGYGFAVVIWAVFGITFDYINHHRCDGLGATLAMLLAVSTGITIFILMIALFHIVPEFPTLRQIIEEIRATHS